METTLIPGAAVDKRSYVRRMLSLCVPVAGIRYAGNPHNGEGIVSYQLRNDVISSA